MATTSKPVPPMPSQDVPVFLPGGQWNPVWYEWLKALRDTLRKVRSEIP